VGEVSAVCLSNNWGAGLKSWGGVVAQFGARIIMGWIKSYGVSGSLKRVSTHTRTRKGSQVGFESTEMPLSRPGLPMLGIISV
jgi:hypothetical protein